MKQLNRLLAKISNGEKVNFQRLVELLPDDVEWEEVFKYHHIEKQFYKVEVIDTDFFQKLLSRTTQPKTKILAAASSDFSSHDVKCDSGYLLVYPSGTRTLSAVSTWQKKVVERNFTPGRHCILIENQDCFFQWQRFTKSFVQQITIEQCDIYFSSGAKILADNILPIITGYNNVHCLFDYDWHGFNIAKNLSYGLVGSIQYLLPDDIDNLESLFKFQPNSSEQYLALLAETDNDQYRKLYCQLEKTQCYMEQEALLSL